MDDMPRDDVGERAHAEGIVAGDAAAIPGPRRQLREQRQCCRTNCAELLDVTGPGPSVDAGLKNCGVLIEAGERAGEPAPGRTRAIPTARGGLAAPQ